MLLELGKKYNTLEEKVDEINKFVVKKKKKIGSKMVINKTDLNNT
jgi:hypothetical protein